MTEYDDVVWELVDSRNPRFNIWRHIKKGYKECFWKNEDPNKLEKEKDNSDSIDVAICNKIKKDNKKKESNKPKDKHAEFNDELYARRMLNENIYKYVMFKLGLTYFDLASMLNMDSNEFYDCLEGLAYFTEDELKMVNKLLQFSTMGSTDMRLYTNEKIWSKKCSGANNKRYLDNHILIDY